MGKSAADPHFGEKASAPDAEKKEFSRAFGERLAHARRTAALTQETLGHALGVSGKAISRWERGTAEAPLSLLPRIALLLHTTVDALLTGVTPTATEEHFPPSATARSESKKETGKMNLNLIPDKAEESMSYLCSWALQEKIADAEGLPAGGTMRQRDVMDAQHLFAPDSAFHPYAPAERVGLYFMLDDGWDVPYGTRADAESGIAMFGSLIPDAEKFGVLGSDPDERLARLSEEIRRLGYAGLGLWVSPQRPFFEGNEEEDERGVRAYWEDRARRSEAAGVRYWKVDWGRYAPSHRYREWMTDAVRTAAPHLLIEHAVGQGPYDGVRSPDEPMAADMRRMLTYSDCFRTYDVIRPFADSATLCRVDALLHGFLASDLRPDCRGEVNVETRYAVAAGLGFQLGIMGYRPETVACLRWQRLSPPFSVRDAVYTASSERLTDRYFFTANPIWWLPWAGKEYDISAPAVMARGTPLPLVEGEGLRPFVLACEHPVRHSFAVSAVRRTQEANPMIAAPAAVTVFPSTQTAPIGIFGHFTKLTIEFPTEIPAHTAVLSQCLYSDRAEAITDRVCIRGRTLTLDGRLLRYLGTTRSGREAEADPALLLLLRY